ncbi:membrane-spanning 4-domains subfamily A member 12-like [Chiloscyllium punctatum]
MSSVVRVDEIVGLNREVNESAGSEIRPHRETRGQRQQDTVPGDDGTVKGLGSAQIVLGMSLVFFGGFLFTDLSMAASTATPWWTGLTLIIAGSLTVSSDNRKTNSELVKAAFGLNIVSCILIGFSVLILSFDIAVTVIFALIYRSWGGPPSKSMQTLVKKVPQMQE